MAVEVDVKTLAAAQADGAPVLDVRDPAEYAAGHLPGAVLIPLVDLPARVGELPRRQRLHVICASGKRSSVAADWLSRAGFDAVSVAGGTEAWRRAGHPLLSSTEERVA